MSEKPQSLRWRLEAERLHGERLQMMRLGREWRAIRRSEWLREDRQARQAAERLYKTAALYDGLGNAPQAIKHYEAFLQQYEAQDALSDFARERLQALGGEQGGPAQAAAPAD